MKFSATAKKRYFSEVDKCIQGEGFVITQLTDDFLDIRYQGTDLCHLVDVSFTSYNPGNRRWTIWHDRFYRMSKENKTALYLLTDYGAVCERSSGTWMVDKNA